MLSTAQIGPQPVDLAARFVLDGSRITIENLGGEAIRFAPAEAAGEAAPSDLRGGFLLEPGERETFTPNGGATFPLWAWGGGEVGVGPAIGPETGGGGGRTLGPQTNTFGDSTTADRSAAEGLRDAYAAANADWLALYNADRDDLILLRWIGGEVVQRRNVAGDAWEDVTDVIKGEQGDKGDKGDKGSSFYVADAAAAYDASADVMSVTVAELQGLNVPKPSLLFLFAPAVLPRNAAQVELHITNALPGQQVPIFSLTGDEIAARDITPGMLLEGIFSRGGRHTLTEPLPPRPQDFSLVAAWVDQDPATADPTPGAVTAAVVAAGASSMTPAVMIPAYPGAATSAYLYFGVPDVAPDIAEMLRVGATGQLAIEAAPDTTEIGGETGKWWRTTSRVSVSSLPGRSYRAVYAPYS